MPGEFEVVVVNPSLLLGPGDLRESSTGDVRQFLERSIPATPAGGMAFVDARDAAIGLLQAFEKGRAGERYLLNALREDFGFSGCALRLRYRRRRASHVRLVP